jgi:hypothetical protein
MRGMHMSENTRASGHTFHSVGVKMLMERCVWITTSAQWNIGMGCKVVKLSMQSTASTKGQQWVNQSKAHDGCSHHECWKKDISLLHFDVTGSHHDRSTVHSKS